MEDEKLLISNELKKACDSVHINHISTLDFKDIDNLVTDNFNSVGSNFKNGIHTFDDISKKDLQEYNDINAQ
jgi:hypothetical protein